MKKSQSRRPILVAVRVPTRSARAQLRKAASLAKMYGAPLRIVHVLAIPQGALARAGAAVKQAAQVDFDGRSVQLQKLAGMKALSGLDVTTTVRCDYPIQDALIREVFECRARMLLVESRGPGRLKRLFLNNVDWELIRNCPCPLWLSTSDRFDPRAPVIAAVDPLHAHAKPAVLDDSIVRRAVEAAGAQPGKVMVCHAFEIPQGAMIDSPIEAYWVAMSADEQRAHEEDLKRAIGRLQVKADIPSENFALVRGEPAVQLPRLVKKHKAGVVVMGAVSRRGLRRMFIGNTAEKVIDKLGCDVLVVKPRGFKSPVERRPHLRPVQRPLRYSMAYRHKQAGGDVRHFLQQELT